METIGIPVMTEEKVREITDSLIKTLLKKNADYGGASFDLGLNGNMVHLWDKIKRYRNLVEKMQKADSDPNFETIEDTLKDIMGYAIIGLIISETENKNKKNG
ncbi:MAG: nucleotide modification associated domain-containing protein [Bacteroidia bacterium]